VKKIILVTPFLIENDKNAGRNNMLPHRETGNELITKSINNLFITIFVLCDFLKVFAKNTENLSLH